MFFKSKYGKLFASFFFASVLLVTLNLNCFADSIGSFKFSDFDYEAHVAQGNGTPSINVTSSMQVSYQAAAFASMSGQMVSVYRFPTQYNSYNKILSLSIPLSFSVGKSYNVKFDYTANYSSNASFFFVIDVRASSDNSTLDTISLYEGSVGSGYQKNSIDVNFNVPYYTQSFYFVFVCLITSGGGNSTVGQAFFFSDMLINSTTVEDEYGSFTPPDSDFSQSSDDLGGLASDIGNLDDYQIDVDELEALFDMDMSDYDNGLTAVKRVVEDVLNATGMLSVLTFFLAFGLAIYILGRRLA